MLPLAWQHRYDTSMPDMSGKQVEKNLAVPAATMSRLLCGRREGAAVAEGLQPAPDPSRPQSRSLAGCPGQPGRPVSLWMHIRSCRQVASA